jgi:hypothetical protein
MDFLRSFIFAVVDGVRRLVQFFTGLIPRFT